MTEWKTIDSAPRGESLLLFVVPFPYDDSYQVVGFWTEDDECWVDSYNHDDIADPTHWMPLPNPPEKLANPAEMWDKVSTQPWRE